MCIILGIWTMVGIVGLGVANFASKVPHHTKKWETIKSIGIKVAWCSPLCIPMFILRYLAL